MTSQRRRYVGTGFRDIALRLTEASITFEQMTDGEMIQLLADAAPTIEDLRGEIEELRLLMSSAPGSLGTEDRPEEAR